VNTYTLGSLFPALAARIRVKKKNSFLTNFLEEGLDGFSSMVIIAAHAQ
jgi:hypothetical protein